MEKPLSVIKITMLQNVYTSVKIDNYNLLSLYWWSRGKSALPLLNEKVKVVNSCVKKKYLKAADGN